MANNVTFKINIDVDDKGKLKSASIDMDKLRGMVASSKSATDNLRDSFIMLNQRIEAVRNVASSFSEMAGTLNSLTGETRKFSGAMAAANTMAGKSGEDFAQLKVQVSELSKQVPIARDELANGLYQVISNGVPEDNWIEYLNKSARASIGGIADLGETVKVTSTVIKNYGLQWDAAGAIQDKIQLTAKNGVTSFEQLAQALPRVTANASTLGVSIDELLASFATLTGVSGNTAEVSTQLSAIFAALVKPSSEAAEMASQMGIEFDAAAIKAAGGMTQFLASLDKSVKQYAASSNMLEQEIYGKLFGSVESLRAINPLVGNLADKFRENVGNMRNSAGTMDEAYKQMGNTGAAELQKLKNAFAELTDYVSSVFTPVLPLLNISAQIGMTLTSLFTLTNAFQSLNIATTAASVTSGLWNAVTIRMNALTATLSATMRGAAVSVGTLRLAIQGLMITLGVGIAIVALSEAIGRLVSSSNQATSDVNTLTEAEQRAEQAHEQTAQQIASVRSEMDLSIAKLNDFKGSKEQEKTLVQQMNAKYGEALGYYATVAQWYKALTANSKTYCDQMINEIRLRDLANRAADLQKQQHDIKYNADGTLKKYSTKNQTTTRVTGQVDAGDGKIIPVRQEVEVKGTSQWAQANKQLTSLYQQEQNVHKEMEKIVATGNKLRVTKVDGWSSIAPNLGTTTGKTGTASTTNATNTTNSSDRKTDPLAGSIDWYEKAISDKQAQLEATTVTTTRKQLQIEIEGLQRELGMMKVEAGIEVEPRIEVKQADKSIIEQIDDQLKDFSGKQKPIVVDVEGADALRDLEKLRSLSNIDVSSFQGVQNALLSIKQISDPTAQSFATAGASCEVLGGALQQLGADSAAAKAGMVMAAIGQLVLSFAQAMVSASSNWITWLAFGVSGTAQLISIVSTLGQFATGGIVGGSQKSGDNVLVRVNSGEMILNAAQQARLFALANGAAVQSATSSVNTGFNNSLSVPSVVVQSQRLQGLMADSSDTRKLDINLKLRGRDLVAAVANETRSNSRRSNIRS